MMSRFHSLPSYSLIFGEEIPENISSLLTDISSELTLSFLSRINHLIFHEFDQIHIFRVWCSQLTIQEQNGLIDLISKNTIGLLGSLNLQLFDQITILQLIDSELCNFKKDGNNLIITKSQQLCLLKAYIATAIKFSNSHRPNLELFTINKELKKFTFQYLTWPLMLKSFGYLIKAQAGPISLKIALFYKYLEKVYPQQFQEYLSYINYETIGEYVVRLVELLSMPYDDSLKNIRFISEIKLDHKESLFDLITIDHEKYPEERKNDFDYTLLKTKPLFKTNKGTFIVLSWQFLFEQYDLTQIFHFYNHSGINSIFKSLPEFKTTFYSSIVMEKVYFKRLIDFIFTDKASDHRKILFDELPENATKDQRRYMEGFPDAYVRIGKTIFLFEFKDAWLPIKVMKSNTFDSISNDLDTKFVNNKGIGQLLNSIVSIYNRKWELLDSLEDHRGRKIHPASLEIFPIIVHTHKIYSLHGVNDYLIRKWEGNSPKKLENIRFLKIHKPVVISLDTLTNSSWHFKDVEYFKSLIIKYLTPYYINTPPPTIHNNATSLEQLNFVNNNISKYESFQIKYSEQFFKDKKKMSKEKFMKLQNHLFK